MVQYIINPWRSPIELLHLRSQLYGISEEENPSIQSSSSVSKRESDLKRSYEEHDSNHDKDRDIMLSKEKEIAVARVRIWMQRGNCPHLVESTAILTSAILNDKKGNEIYCVRAVYAAAFCRFVTGLLDCHQEKRYKLSMYALAKNIGLPASFVEIRHQATHEELPSLCRLRIATQKALGWIWSYYWINLPALESSNDIYNAPAVLEKQLWLLISDIKNDGLKYTAEVARLLNQWPKHQLLNQLFQFQNSEDDINILLHVARLLSKVLQADSEVSSAPSDIEDVKIELEAYNRQLNAADLLENETKEEDTHLVDQSKGWALWEGPWIPKPIGIV